MLPVNSSKLRSVLTAHTKSLLQSFHFSDDRVHDTIIKLGHNKFQVHDMISICILKLYEGSIWKPLEIIFKRENISL